ncbi:MAG: hypothetical protein HYY17_16525 [Planctomycetes bacterium]|nr:hypothetical protein [Planctomycetota bacterium]
MALLLALSAVVVAGIIVFLEHGDRRLPPWLRGGLPAVGAAAAVAAVVSARGAPSFPYVAVLVGASQVPSLFALVRWFAPGLLAAVKVGLVLLMLAGLAAVTAATVRASRGRAQLTHCRNNLRMIGGVGATMLYADGAFDIEKTGRNFWHEVRIVSFRRSRPLGPTKVPAVDCRETPCRDPQHWHQWARMDPDPFLCPVWGKTRSHPDDPAAIDYRGPKELSETRPARFVIGGDRDGYHPDGGGFILFADQSIKERQSEVEFSVPASVLWKQAAAALVD